MKNIATAFDDILQREEFQQSTLGIHISKNGVSYCIHPAHQDVSSSFIKETSGCFSKQQILVELNDWDIMLKEYLPKINILATTVSFPGPIDGENAEIPNWWSTGENRFSKSEFSKFRFGKHRLDFINEIQSLGHGLLSTDEFYGLEDDFMCLWKPPALEVMPTLYPLYLCSDPAAVLQVSHGLGAAFLIPIDSSDSYRVIASEWGHSFVQLCGPEETGYDEEFDLVSFIGKKSGSAVEWEDICSLRGLVNCFMFVSKTNMKADQIIDTIRKDPTGFHSSKALSIHFKFLMRFARMCAISFTCKSVFLTYNVFEGGNKALMKHITQCRDEFMHFTKSEWVSSVSVFIQTSNKNISAEGVMYHAFLRLARSEGEEIAAVDGDGDNTNEGM